MMAKVNRPPDGTPSEKEKRKAAAGKRKKLKKRGEKRIVHMPRAHPCVVQQHHGGDTDTEGNVVAWSSAGGTGARAAQGGRVRGDPGGAQCGNAAKTVGMRSLDVRVKGPGSGRESAIRALQTVGLEVKSIRDVTPIPHNGCRPPKRRRV